RTWPLRHALYRAGVDRERIGPYPDLAVLALDDAPLEIDIEPHQVLAALEEVAPVGTGVEADDVVGEDPPVDLLAHRRRHHPPRVRLAPRDVDEVVKEDVRPSLSDQAGERVEMVIVDHHHGVLDILDLLEHGPGQIFVDDVVAEL